MEVLVKLNVSGFEKRLDTPQNLQRVCAKCHTVITSATGRARMSAVR
jgi:hypothetical protein